jgi:hypothetical protein
MGTKKWIQRTAWTGLALIGVFSTTYVEARGFGGGGGRGGSRSEGSFSKGGAASSGNWQSNRAGMQSGAQSNQTQRQQSWQSYGQQQQQSRQSYGQQQQQNRQNYANSYDNYHPTYNYYGGGYYPSTGGAFAAGALTGAVIGSVMTAASFNAMSAPKTPVYVNGVTYYQVGSTWYQPVYQGGSVTYVVVNPPQ